MKPARSIAEARSQLPRLVREAEDGAAIELTRHGKRVAVLLGVDEYERLIAVRGGFAERFEAFRRRHRPETLTIDPDEIFGDARERDPGREVAL